MDARVTVRAVINWANLSTLLGLAIAVGGRAGISRAPGGLFIAEHSRWMLPTAGAFTVGNVIITGGAWADLTDRLPDALDHESRHASQYAYCLGLGFLPLYAVAAAWSIVRTGKYGVGNFFEREAGLVSGGYAAGGPSGPSDATRAADAAASPAADREPALRDHPTAR